MPKANYTKTGKKPIIKKRITKRGGIKVDPLPEILPDNQDDLPSISLTSGSGRPDNSNRRVLSSYAKSCLRTIALNIAKRYGEDELGLCKILSVDAATLQGWKVDDPEFENKMGINKEKFDSAREAVKEKADNIAGEKFDSADDVIAVDRDVENCRKVEDALLQRALGYEYVVHKYEDVIPKGELTKDGKCIAPVVKHTKFTRHQLPDVTAQIFYLKNLLPERWSETYEAKGTIDHNHDHGGVIRIDDSSERAGTVAEILFKAGAIRAGINPSVKAKIN